MKDLDEEHKGGNRHGKEREEMEYFVIFFLRQ
jgi:hypothetical protein